MDHPVNTRTDRLVVLVATFNRLALLRVVVDSILSGTATPHELIVIDGGSTDGTIDYIQSYPPVTAMLQAELVGTARCYNRVWRRVESEFTCWLSDDTEIVPGSLDTAVAILESDPTIGMVGLKMKDTKGPGRFEAYRGGISEYGILNCNHGVFRTKLGRQVGFFNEAYRAYMIDPDLTASILSTGHRVVMTKAVAVLHHREWAEREGDEKVAREMGGIDNVAVYRDKFRFLAPSLTLATRVRARGVGAAARVLFAGARPGARRFCLNRRDWVNLAGGRFLSLLDPVTSIGRPYHLAQALPGPLLASAVNPYRALVNRAGDATTCARSDEASRRAI